MSPPYPSDSGADHGEDDDSGDDTPEFRPPLPPEDRIWRHPSEVAVPAPDRTVDRPTNQPTNIPGPSLTRVPRILGVATLAALIGATTSLAVVAVVGGFDSDTTVVERSVAIQPVTSAASDDDTVAAIAARTGPAVVAVRSIRDGAQTSGSAIVLRSDGYLLTNAHLVDGATSIEVTTEGSDTWEATVVGSDALTGVAVLRIDATDLEPAALGSSATVGVGDQCIVMGAAFADGWSSEVTIGVISGLERRLRTLDGAVLYDMMLADVAVGDETAGGPLLDVNGAVIGITSGIPATGDGTSQMGVATPIDVARRVSDQLIAYGRARHVWLGVEGVDLPRPEAVELGLSGGALISRVIDDGPADTAGVIDGDVIVAVDDQTIDSMSALVTALRSHEPGHQVQVGLRRGPAKVTIDVVLAERAASGG